MDYKKFILEFIERCQNPEFQKEVQKNFKFGNLRNNKWHRENREKVRKANSIYERTEKGKLNRKKVNKNRQERFRSAREDLSWVEKENIGNFYKNCPLGYEVDHIIPISRGGKHCLSNLQYLTHHENSEKANKTPEEYLEFKKMLHEI